MKLKRISLDQIDEPSRELRSVILQEGLEELKASIKHVGVLQPIRVFERNGRYEIIDGHRRYLASKLAGLVTVPCFVVDSRDDQVEVEKIHANLAREDVSAIDIARMLYYLKEERGYSTDDLCQLMGKSQGRISQYLALLSYDPVIQEAVEDKRLPERHARQLQKIKDPSRRKMYVHHAVDGGASDRTIASWVAQEEYFEQFEGPPPPVEQVAVDAPPPTKLTMICPCCRDEVDQNNTLMLQLCQGCYAFTKELYRRVAQEEKEG